MSSALPARAATLRASLTALDAMASNVHETGLLTDLREELRKEVDLLDHNVLRGKLLESGGVAVSTMASVKVARDRTASVRERFLVEPKSATLKAGKHWTALLKELRTAATDADAAAKAAWREFCVDAYTGEKPATLRGQLADTDHNRSALQRYETKFQALQVASVSLPQSVDDIARVKQIGIDLKAITKEFDHDVPAAVKTFIDAVRGGGAALGLLSPEVIEWLGKNKAFDQYRIVTAR